MKPKPTLSAAALKKLAQNHTGNPALEFKSKDAVIRLSELEAFLAEAKERHGDKFDGVHVYFVRYPLKTKKAEAQITKVAGTNLSQVSLVLVASRILQGKPNWKLRDLVRKGALSALPVCHPAMDNGTGICPPACGGRGGKKS